MEFGSVIKWHVVKAAWCSANPAVRGQLVQGFALDKFSVFINFSPFWFCTVRVMVDMVVTIRGW
jgi:hypothetical protein